MDALLRKAGFESEINNGQIFNISTNSFEVFVEDEDGDNDYEATELLKEKASTICGWGGYRTGYGSWVFDKNYSYNELVALNID